MGIVKIFSVWSLGMRPAAQSKCFAKMLKNLRSVNMNAMRQRLVNFRRNLSMHGGTGLAVSLMD